MSRIEADTAAVNRIVSSRSQAAFPDASTRRQGQSPDQSMMYAWSIGTTTRAVQERAPELPRKYEECPPEVYIG